MLKFIIILILTFYVFSKVVGFFFRLLFGSMRGTVGNSDGRQSHQSRKAPGSNLNIDNVPVNKNRHSSYQGGEYVDYEEIK